jgi:DNA-binding HxlR family transcriptional regulator
MIVRELLIGPRRFTELENGLPGIPTNVLSARLREMEEHGLVERRLLPRPANSVVYELTDYGRELEEPLLTLGRWGARSLPIPTDNDFVATSTVALSFRAMFHPAAAEGVDLTFEVPVQNYLVRGRINDGVLTVPVECGERPDLFIQGDPATMMDLFYGREAPAAALAAQRIEVDGSAEDMERFFQIFHLN